MNSAKTYELCPGGAAKAQDFVALSYDQRLLRRKKLVTMSGVSVFVDLPQTISVSEGDAFLCDDGRVIGIKAAEEALFAVTGATVTRYAWHIGNRHTPCEITPERLVIQRDPVLKAMLEQLGAKVSEIVAPFSPEGGAYGHGRTLGHDHGHDHGAHDHGGHDHAHGHERGHSHDHSHDEAHAHHHHHHGQSDHSHD